MSQMCMYICAPKWGLLKFKSEVTLQYSFVVTLAILRSKFKP